MALKHGSAPEMRGTGTGTRLAIGLQVLLAAFLATLAVLLVTWLAERHGWRLRYDMTASEANTLDPASLDVIDKLPGDVTVDVFFRACEPPLQEAGAHAQDKLRHLLLLAREHPSSRGKIEVVEHDLSNRAQIDARADERRRALNISVIEPGGLVAVSMGARHEIMRLRGDIADLDPGNPDPRAGPYIPPRLVHFRGEEALMRALLKVSQGDAPKVVFAIGHGERSTQGADAQRDATRLAQGLEADGFHVERWDGARGAAIPVGIGETGVLAIVGPEQPFAPAEYAAIRAFVESGGRLFASVGLQSQDGDNSLARLLAEWGIKPRMRGFVARPVAQAGGGEIEEVPECVQEMFADRDGMPALNPITESSRRDRRRVYLPFSRAIERGEKPSAANLLDLLRSPEGTWIDLPMPGSSTGNYKLDENEEVRRYTLAMQATFPPLRPVPAANPSASTGHGESAQPECRIVALGSSDACANVFFDSNRDFLLNAFNWLSAREYRVHVSKQDPDARRIDVKTGRALATVYNVTFLLMPGLCLVAGLFTAWRRHRR